MNPFLGQMAAGVLQQGLNPAMGNMQARAATFGNQSYTNPIGNYAASTGAGLQGMYDRNLNQSRQFANEDARMQQGYAMQNAGFKRGLEADQMRQATFNTMGINDQNNRANAAASLLDSYNQARAAAMQMATASLY